MPRVIIVGLDGLTLDLIRRLLPAEALPALRARLSPEGTAPRSAAGPLRSVFPTQSAAAWASFMTGQTPARHGVFDFMVRAPDGRYRHAKPDAATTLWHILGRSGYRVGVYDFPATFPPDQVDGWLVAGMLSPDLEGSSYPPALGAELRARFPDYRLDVEWLSYEDRPADLLRDVEAVTRQHGAAARYLLEREPVDCFAAAFTLTDRAQHALWRFIDPAHPRYDPVAAEALKPSIVGFYRALDEAVAELLAHEGPETLVVLLSDHGFQPAAWQFHVDCWLEREGWLTRRGGLARLERWLRRLDSPHVRQFRRRLYPDVSRHVAALSPGGTIDWARTLAFCPWNFHQGVRLNVRGREPHGQVAPGAEYERVRDEIAGALRNLRHPGTGAPVVASVQRVEELYAGPYLPAMPDLVLDLQPNFAPGIHRPTLFESTGWASGDHSLDGFVALSGRDVASGRLTGANLIDIAPTVLAWLGVTAPGELDGKALLAGGRAGTRPPETPSASGGRPLAPPRTPALTPEDEAAVLERLRRLGYL